MAKKIKSIIKLHISAGQATPAPPIGPSLASHGLNIPEFCQKFNNKTENIQGATVPVKITVYEDRTYDFEVKTPLVVDLLKKAARPISEDRLGGPAGIEKGSGTPNKTKVGKITREQVQEIARKKMPDLNASSLEKAEKTIMGTAKQMGIIVEK